MAPAATVHHLPWFAGAFTSMFMHASWIHIGGNMLFLWIFGNNVEDSMGRVRFLVWYLLAGLAATATQTVVTLADHGRGRREHPEHRRLGRDRGRARRVLRCCCRRRAC